MVDVMPRSKNGEGSHRPMGPAGKWDVRVVILGSDDYETYMSLGWEPFAVALIPKTSTLLGADIEIVPWVSVRIRTEGEI